MSLISKLNVAENVMYNIQLNDVVDKKGNKFVRARIEGATFNPEKFVPNGGPVTKKQVVLLFDAETSEAAQNKALEGFAKAIGLGE